MCLVARAEWSLEVLLVYSSRIRTYCTQRMVGSKDPKGLTGSGLAVSPTPGSGCLSTESVPYSTERMESPRHRIVTPACKCEALGSPLLLVMD